MSFGRREYTNFVLSFRIFRMMQKQKQKSHAPYVARGKQISSADKQRRWTLGLIIGLCGFLLYSNTLSHNYVLDDFFAIKENNIEREGVDAISDILKTSYRQGYLSVKDGLYRPLSLATYAIEWNYFPDKPGVRSEERRVGKECRSRWS